jgi:hypothetical protein
MVVVEKIVFLSIVRGGALYFWLWRCAIPPIILDYPLYWTTHCTGLPTILDHLYKAYNYLPGPDAGLITKPTYIGGSAINSAMQKVQRNYGAMPVQCI